MVTQAEEQQAKEFLKRAEIRTMRKDLMALRETDALKERDKITKLKTLDEQLEEQQTAKEKARAMTEAEKAARNEVLGKNESQEKIAEKDLKNYATEQERQQIFLLESQKLGFEKQADEIDKEKDPSLKLEKNNYLLKLRDWQTKLNSILEQEKKLEGEQKFLAEKAQSSTSQAERKALESSRWDMDRKIQDIEKTRWDAEKQIETLNNKINETDKASEELVKEKNDLRNKILGADKQLRELYSVVIAREEEKRSGLAADQRARLEAVTKAKEEKNEGVRRQQWSGVPVKMAQVKEEKFLGNASKNVREKIMKEAETEEEQRKKFLQDVETWTETGGKNEVEKEQKKTEPSVLEKAILKTPQELKVPVPPVPHKK
ncbi:MAG: hypothetical protein NT026_02635 [Candidatus Staskawiczbacteria bacterium]|nr:hypothetical protein [Candidatus Staskawiczbacteria bacterium]